VEVQAASLFGCYLTGIVELEGDRAECLKECGSPAVVKASPLAGTSPALEVCPSTVIGQ